MRDIQYNLINKFVKNHLDNEEFLLFRVDKSRSHQMHHKKVFLGSSNHPHRSQQNQTGIQTYSLPQVLKYLFSLDLHQTNLLFFYQYCLTWGSDGFVFKWSVEVKDFGALKLYAEFVTSKKPCEKLTSRASFWYTF